MIIVTTLNTVKNRDEYVKLAKDFVADLRTVPGCLEMHLGIPEDAEDKVFFVSKWTDKESWKNHIGGEVFMKHIPRVSPYFVTGVDSFFEVID